jgi:hypothetical protein
MRQFKLDFSDEDFEALSAAVERKGVTKVSFLRQALRRQLYIDEILRDPQRSLLIEEANGEVRKMIVLD